MILKELSAARRHNCFAQLWEVQAEIHESKLMLQQQEDDEETSIETSGVQQASSAAAARPRSYLEMLIAEYEARISAAESL